LSAKKATCKEERNEEQRDGGEHILILHISGASKRIVLYDISSPSYICSRKVVDSRGLFVQGRTSLSARTPSAIAEAAPSAALAVGVGHSYSHTSVL
jgi:hypothetical protein